MDKYIIVCWPDSQMLMELDGFRDNCCLINDSSFVDSFDSSAYFVNEVWHAKNMEL